MAGLAPPSLCFDRRRAAPTPLNLTAAHAAKVPRSFNKHPMPDIVKGCGIHAPDRPVEEPVRLCAQLTKLDLLTARKLEEARIKARLAVRKRPDVVILPSHMSGSGSSTSSGSRPNSMDETIIFGQREIEVKRRRGGTRECAVLLASRRRKPLLTIKSVKAQEAAKSFLSIVVDDSPDFHVLRSVTDPSASSAAKPAKAKQLAAAAAPPAASQEWKEVELSDYEGMSSSQDGTRQPKRPRKNGAQIVPTEDNIDETLPSSIPEVEAYLSLSPKATMQPLIDAPAIARNQPSRLLAQLGVHDPCSPSWRQAISSSSAGSGSHYSQEDEELEMPAVDAAAAAAAATAATTGHDSEASVVSLSPTSLGTPCMAPQPSFDSTSDKSCSMRPSMESTTDAARSRRSLASDSRYSLDATSIESGPAYSYARYRGGAKPSDTRDSSMNLSPLATTPVSHDEDLAFGAADSGEDERLLAHICPRRAQQQQDSPGELCDGFEDRPSLPYDAHGDHNEARFTAGDDVRHLGQPEDADMRGSDEEDDEEMPSSARSYLSILSDTSLKAMALARLEQIYVPKQRATASPARAEGGPAARLSQAWLAGLPKRLSGGSDSSAKGTRMESLSL